MQRILLQWLVLIQNLLLIVWYQAVTGSDIIGTLGNSVSIDCKLPISDTLIWESRDGNVIAVRGQPVVRDSTKYVIEKQHGVREFLVIHNLTLADETEYCCYDLRHTHVKDRTTLTILVRPHTVKMVYPEGVVNEGSEILLQCLAVGGKPSPNIRWFMTDSTGTTRETIGSVNDHVFANGTGSRSSSLRFNVTRNYYNSTLACNMSVSVLFERSFQYSPDVQLFPQPPVISGFDGVYDENGTVHVACTSSGSRPTANMMWMLNGTTVPDFEVLVMPEKNGTFTVTSYFRGKLSRAMNGSLLICSVTNSVMAQANLNMLRTNVTLLVSYLPVITTAGNDVITARAGDNVRFLFHMTSRPAPFLLELLKEGHRVNESLYRFENHSHSNTIDVVLSNVTRMYSGHYNLSAMNRLGNVTGPVVELNVLYRPVCAFSDIKKQAIHINRTVHLFCHMFASPSDVTMTWRYRHTRQVINTTQSRKDDNNKEQVIGDIDITVTSLLQYTTTFIECHGNNSIGMSTEPCIYQLVQTGPPEPPTNCTINYRSNDVTFFCTPNFDGGSNQTFAFQVLISNEYRTMVNKTVPDFSLMHFHSIRNLTIRVCSVNVEFPDMYACTEAFQASIYNVSSDPLVAEPVNTAAYIAGGVVGFIGFLCIFAIIIFILRRKQKTSSKRNDILKTLGLSELQSDKGGRESTKRWRVRSEINPAFSLSTISHSIEDVAEHTEVYTDATNVIASAPFKKDFATLQEQTDSKGHRCQNQAMELNLNSLCSTNSDNSSQGIHDVSNGIQLSPITKPVHKESILSSMLDQESTIQNNFRAVDETVSEYNSLNIYSAADIADILDETQYIETDQKKAKDGIQQQIYSVINISDTTIRASHIDYSATDILNVLDIISEKETIYDKPNNILLAQGMLLPLVHALDTNGTEERNHLDNQSTCSHSPISNTVAEHMIVRSNSFPFFKRHTIFTSKNIDDSSSEFTRKHTRCHSFTSENYMSERALSNDKSVDFLKICTLPKNCSKSEFILKSPQTNGSASLSEVNFDNNEMTERSNKLYNYTPADSGYVDAPLDINTHTMLLNNYCIGNADKQLDINTHTNSLNNKSINIQDTSKTEHVEINRMQSDSKQTVDRDNNQSWFVTKDYDNDKIKAVLVEQSEDNEEYFDASDIMELSSRDGEDQCASTLHSRLPYLNTEV